MNNDDDDIPMEDEGLENRPRLRSRSSVNSLTGVVVHDPDPTASPFDSCIQLFSSKRFQLGFCCTLIVVAIVSVAILLSLSSTHCVPHSQRRYSRDSNGLISGGSATSDQHALLERASRMLHGEKVNIEEVPWQVSLAYRLKTDPSRSIHLCGGAILSVEWVLTAARCCRAKLEEAISTSDGYVALEVVAGSECRSELGGTTDEFSLLYPETTCFVHPQFNSLHREGGVIDHDIALLHVERKSMNLSRAFDGTPVVGSVQIGLSSTNISGNLIMSGWGASDQIRSETPTLLRAGPIYLSPSCTDEDLEDRRLNESQFICSCNQPLIAASRFCLGDLGGPLVKETGPETRTVVGVAAYGTFRENILNATIMTDSEQSMKAAANLNSDSSGGDEEQVAKLDSRQEEEDESQSFDRSLVEDHMQAAESCRSQSCAIFTAVAPYSDWIEKVIFDHSRTKSIFL